MRCDGGTSVAGSRVPRDRAGLDSPAVRRLPSRTFRKTHSTPSAADSESSPDGIERASGSCLRPRGRRFAESDAFFGGAGSEADKFRIFPRAKLSAFSVVAPQAIRRSRSYRRQTAVVAEAFSSLVLTPTLAKGSANAPPVSSNTSATSICLQVCF